MRLVGVIRGSHSYGRFFGLKVSCESLLDGLCDYRTKANHVILWIYWQKSVLLSINQKGVENTKVYILSIKLNICICKVCIFSIQLDGTFTEICMTQASRSRIPKLFTESVWVYQTLIDIMLYETTGHKRNVFTFILDNFVLIGSCW